MTRPWNPSLYRTHDVQTPVPPADTIAGLMSAVSSCTSRLQSQPYDPALWTERAGYYLRLNDPELAVGDAYRARLLFEREEDGEGGTSRSGVNALEGESGGVSEECRLQTFTILGQGLYDCHCHWECFEFWLSLTQAKRLPRVSRLAFTKANALKQLLAQKKEAAASYGDVFTLGESISSPLRILQQLGIDVFSSSHDFSTMVLHTLWTRVANNKAGSYDAQLGFVDAVSALLPLFNHSCEPSVEYKKEEGTSTIRFFALRDIEQGEEVFDSYRDVEDLEREERVERLWPWFERACLCGRCEREEASSKE